MKIDSIIYLIIHYYVLQIFDSLENEGNTYFRIEGVLFYNLAKF
jgi:hypothetical protein